MLIETPKDICRPMGVWIECFDTNYPGKSNFQVIGLICCGQLFLQIYVFSLGIIRDQNHTDLAHYQALRKIPKLRIQTSGEFLVVWVLVVSYEIKSIFAKKQLIETKIWLGKPGKNRWKTEKHKWWPNHVDLFNLNNFNLFWSSKKKTYFSLSSFVLDRFSFYFSKLFN